MISLKPIFLWKYLKLEKNKIPRNIKRLFYLSWEDALWDILDKKKIIKGSTVLVPEFFCGDVEENIRNHGYRVEYYPVDRKLTTSPSQLIKSISKYSPSVIVILHPVGITNQLFMQNYWVKHLKSETILIEDSVHRIVDPTEIKFIKKNHFIIDSLRKVVPLQGSDLYGQKDDLDFSLPPHFQSTGYAIRVTILWGLMNVLWMLAHWTDQSDWSFLTNWSNWLSHQATYLMKSGYKLIGDSVLPARGFVIFGFLQQFIDYEKVRIIKLKQIEFYEMALKNLPKNIFEKVPYLHSDKYQMMAYPLVLPLGLNNSPLNFELDDSKWSEKQKIIYLPIGPHLDESHLNKIVKRLDFAI